MGMGGSKGGGGVMSNPGSGGLISTSGPQYWPGASGPGSSNGGMGAAPGSGGGSMYSGGIFGSAPRGIGLQSGLGQGGIGAPPSGTILGGTPGQSGFMSGSFGPGSPTPTGPGPGGVPNGYGQGRMYAGGSNTFDEAGNQPYVGNGPPPVSPGASPITNAGPSANPQMLGNLLKRWDGTGQLGAQPGVPDRGMGYQAPGGGATSPGVGPPTTGGVPGLPPGDFGPPGQSGNSQDAISQAMATGNQGALQGQGSQATNSDINSAFYNRGVANPYYQANQAKLNRQGPAYQPGGMFYNKAIDG